MYNLNSTSASVISGLVILNSALGSLNIVSDNLNITQVNLNNSLVSLLTVTFNNVVYNTIYT